MGYWKYLLAIVGLILVIASVNAQTFTVHNFPTVVSVNELPVEMSFEVKNLSSERQSVELQVFVPVAYEITQPLYWISADDEKEVKIRLIPDESITGMQYNSTILITVGTETMEKNVRIVFSELNECPVDVEITEKDAGLFHLTMENPWFNDAEFEILGVEGLPADWGYGFSETIQEVSARANQEVDLELNMVSGFDGTAKIRFSCGEFGEMTQDFEIVHEGTETPGPTGFFIFGDIDLGNLGNTELLVDVLLIAVAAILLIAFIVKYSKLLNFRK